MIEGQIAFSQDPQALARSMTQHKRGKPDVIAPKPSKK
jgi:hypothetical protein